MKITPAPLLTLSNGVEMPRLGLGTWPMNDAEAAETVALALDMGYRLIDTAENYENERGVGEGIRRSGVARGELFVTTKFNRKWHSVEGARQACEASLERLGLDYIDLFLVHWPNPDQGRYVEAFEGLVKLQGGRNEVRDYILPKVRKNLCTPACWNFVAAHKNRIIFLNLRLSVDRQICT